MHYLCEKLPWIKISEVYVQAEREVSVPWLWNLVNQESMFQKHLPQQYLKYVD